MWIYIKDMEMPKKCEDCPFCDYEQGNCLAAAEKNTLPHNGFRKDWCPLISVSPHGRLIDADAFIAEQQHL